MSCWSDVLQQFGFDSTQVKAFVDAELTPDVWALVTPDDLIALGVSQIGRRLKFFNHVRLTAVHASPAPIVKPQAQHAASFVMPTPPAEPPPPSYEQLHQAFQQQQAVQLQKAAEQQNEQKTVPGNEQSKQQQEPQQQQQRALPNKVCSCVRDGDFFQTSLHRIADKCSKNHSNKCKNKRRSKSKKSGTSGSSNQAFGRLFRLLFCFLRFNLLCRFLWSNLLHRVMMQKSTGGN